MVDSSSWTGEIVAESDIDVVAKVINGCDPAVTQTKSESVKIYPILRRPGWRMSLGSSVGVEPTWLKTEPKGFPGYSKGDSLGQNNNTITKYKKLPEQIITPIYEDLTISHPDEYDPMDWPTGTPNDFGSFSSIAEEIMGGPNVGLFYNGSTSIYTISRVAQINYWTTPSATPLPTIAPALDPFGNSYSRWADIYGSNPEDCGCSNPTAHGGDGITNIRSVTNVYHEKTGSPGSTNQDKLGHYTILRDAVNGPNTTDHDVLWNIDLEYAASEDELRLIDEEIRYRVNGELLAESATLHGFVDETPQKHNFYGVHYFADEGTQTWDPAETITY